MIEQSLADAGCLRMFHVGTAVAASPAAAVVITSQNVLLWPTERLNSGISFEYLWSYPTAKPLTRMARRPAS